MALSWTAPVAGSGRAAVSGYEVVAGGRGGGGGGGGGGAARGRGATRPGG